MKKTRKRYAPELKKELAQGYRSGTLTSAQIEERGIPIGHVRKWMHAIFGDSKRVKPADASAASKPATVATEGTKPATPDAQPLSRRKIKLAPNRRYSPEDKAAVMQMIGTVPLATISEKTGVTLATLHLWKKQQKKHNGANGTALVPLADKSSSPRKAELLLNPTSTEALLSTITKSEGFVNMEKAAKQLKAAHRAGLIEDYDEIDLRWLLGFRQVTGAPLRSRK